jgi:putative spermidine/putrescine transport system ATP-binding protein
MSDSTRTETPTATGAALILTGVQKSFGDAVAVRDVNLDLRPGEFLTMLGPSGSGKTTTLNMIAGFLQPDAGTVTLDGRDITTTPAHGRNIGVVFQNYALFPHLSAIRNVAFPLEMRGVGRKEAARRAHGALELVELQHCADRRPAQLSGGQQQRIALARAFVFEPGLLLMDEPLGALDKRLRETMQLEIMRICRTVGSTVVYVTHDQEEALTMSDRIAIYHEGAIEQIGTAEDLYERPATTFVADFVGDSTILLGAWRADGAVAGAGWVATGGSAATGSAGSRASVVVRPEMVRLSSAVAGEPAVNQLNGQVTDVVYLGSQVKYIVAGDGGQELHARVARSAQLSRFGRGDRVSATWAAEDCVVLRS